MREIITNRYSLYNGDCVEVAAQLPSNRFTFRSSVRLLQTCISTRTISGTWATAKMRRSSSRAWTI